MPCKTELTDDKVNYFFNMEIGILDTTLVKLLDEGTNRPEELAEFNADDMSVIA